MSALAAAAGLLDQELPLLLGLLIPFLGIVIPSIVIFAIAAPPRRTHAAAGVPVADGMSASAIATPPPAAAPAAEGRGTARRDEQSWLCERLRESDIFEGLTDHELRLVASIGERRQVAPGERLAQAGHRGDTLFLILSGEFRLLTHGQGEIPVRMAHPGETVPLAVIIDPPVLVTTIEAIPAGEVLAIPRMRLLDLFDIQPMLGLQVYRAAAKSFEHRYRKSLDGLVDALRVALQPTHGDTLTPQPQD